MPGECGYVKHTELGTPEAEEAASDPENWGTAPRLPAVSSSVWLRGVAAEEAPERAPANAWSMVVPPS